MPFVEVNGVRLHVHETGEGTPLILIHPPLMNMQVFNYQKAQLADAFRVVTFDIRGHGLSEPSEAPLTYSLIARDILDLMNALDMPKAYVCGYSTGGGIALEAMLQHPERVLGGILVSAMPEVSDPYLAIRLRMAIGLSRGWTKGLLARAICYGNSDMDMTYRNLMRGSMQGDIRNIRQYYMASLLYSCTNRLKSIRLPQLLIYGSKDGAFHRYAHLLKRELPNAELFFVHGVSHQIPTKAPRKMNDLIRHWVSRLEELREDEGDAGVGEAVYDAMLREELQEIARQ